jgi:hypothetical protein
MPGSPKKRAAREAAERAKNLQLAAENTGDTPQSAPDGETPAPVATLPAPAVTPIRGEVLPPEGAPEPTRTAMKRAMRSRAQEHAEKAIGVLVVNLDSKDPKLAQQAANDLLAWGFGKPVSDIDLGNGDQIIVIRKFGDEN